MNPTPRFRFPHEGESALHFSETIAHSHGWQSVNQLLVACDHKRIVNWNKPSKSIQSALEAIIAPFEYERPLNLLALQPKPNSQKQLKVCLQCIKGNLPHLVKNQMPFNTHCDIHHSQLQDKCKSCGTKIKSSILNYCRACDAPLNNVHNVQNYVLFSAQLGVEKERFLICLLQLADHFIRPLDIFNEPPNWDTLDNAQITHLISIAFQFLVTEDALLQYKKKLYAQHSNYLHMAIGILTNKVEGIERAAQLCKESMSVALPSCMCATLFNHNDLMVTSMVVSPTRAMLAKCSSQALETHCSAGQLAKILGVRTGVIATLVSEGGLVPLNRVNQVAKMIFCIKASISYISQRLSQVPKREQPNFVSLVKISDTSLTAYGVDKSDIIFAALRLEIPACFDISDSNNGGQFKVQVEALLDYLKRYNTVEEHITVKDFAERLMVPDYVVEELLKACDDLYYAKYVKTGPNLIDQLAAESFLLNYISINREAWLYGVPPHEVKALLGTYCYSDTSLVFKELDPHKEYVFLKTDSYITNSLDMIFDDIPYRLFIPKFGRREFPTIEKSLISAESAIKEEHYAD
jgi:hypothetical protein